MWVSQHVYIASLNTLEPNLLKGIALNIANVSIEEIPQNYDAYLSSLKVMPGVYCIAKGNCTFQIKVTNCQQCHRLIAVEAADNCMHCGEPFKLPRKDWRELCKKCHESKAEDPS